MAPISLDYSLYDKVLRHITVGGVSIILGLALKQHKIWIRLTDQMDSLWKEFCKLHDIPYKPLRNGTK